MGLRRSGEGPRVMVDSNSKKARVRIDGRVYWLGPRPAGKISPEQTARAARL
jgi:hypothetical protein